MKTKKSPALETSTKETESVELRGINICLESLIGKFEPAEAELRELKAAEPLLRKDVDQLLAELHGLNPKFLIMRPEPGDLDTATEAKLARLQVARGKLEVLPGVISKCESKAGALATEISNFVQAGIDDIREKARVRLDKLSAELEPQLRVICGNNLARTQATLEVVIENSETNRWLKSLPREASYYGEFAVQRAQKFLKVAAGFEVGKTLSESFA